MIFGIDLGTTFCAVAYINTNGEPEIVPRNADGDPLTTPSVLWVGQDELLVGKAANDRRINAAGNIIEYIKREMGKPVKAFSKTIWGIQYSADELAAVLLYKLAADANTYLKEQGIIEHDVTDVVITVPANFDETRRSATRLAGELAGLNVISIINEPTAAALAHGVGINESKIIKIFDLGGGTLDITLLRSHPDGRHESLISDGDMEIGGRNFDGRLYQYIVNYNELGTLSNDDSHKLMAKVREAKIRLTDAEKTKIIVPLSKRKIEIDVFRKDFETAAVQLMSASRSKCQNVIERAKEKNYISGWPDVHSLVVVGGASRMPMVRKMLEGIYDGDIREGEYDFAIAKGAAYFAVSQKSIVDISPKSLGVLIDVGGKEKVSVMIEKNVPLPCEKAESYLAPPNAIIKIMQGVDGKKGEVLDINRFAEIGQIILQNKEKYSVDIVYRYQSNGIIEVDYNTPDGRKVTRPITQAFFDFTDESFQEKKRKVDKLIERISF